MLHGRNGRVRGTEEFSRTIYASWTRGTPFCGQRIQYGVKVSGECDCNDVNNRRNHQTGCPVANLVSLVGSFEVCGIEPGSPTCIWMTKSQDYRKPAGWWWQVKFPILVTCFGKKDKRMEVEVLIYTHWAVFGCCWKVINQRHHQQNNGRWCPVTGQPTNSTCINNI